MTIKKITQLGLLALSIQCGSSVYAASITSPVDIYFLPREYDTMYQSLNELLSNTKGQLLVAMYWITDENIINRLIDLKNKGIDVHIILDESSNNSSELINKLLNNDIIPLVMPTTGVKGIMHNKFLIFDNKIVWTGSANFTKTVLNLETKYENNENILILNSQDIAKKYSVEFANIETEILNIYIDLITKNKPEQLPHWLHKVCTAYFSNYPGNTTLLHESYKKFNKVKKNRLIDFFPDIKLSNIEIADIAYPSGSQQTEFEPATSEQIRLLKKLKVITEGISKQEADEIISSIRPNKKYTTEQQPEETSLTPGQKRFLKKHKISTENMSRLEARKIIESIEKKPKNTFKPYYKK